MHPVSQPVRHGRVAARRAVRCHASKGGRPAARLGDNFFIDPLADSAPIRERNVIFRDELSKAGKPFPAEFPVFREICVAKDRATAFKIAEPALLGKYRDYARWGIGKGISEPSLEELARERFFSGSPEDW